jgi:hypothetical protein
MKKYYCRCGNHFASEQKPLCCPSCLQQKDFIEEPKKTLKEQIEEWAKDPD